MDSLKHLLESLPPELYKEIFEWTFTPERSQPVVVQLESWQGGAKVDVTLTPSTNERVIVKDYKPPKLLQINRASRALFAEAYYGSGSISYIEEGRLDIFLESLAKKHATQIREFRQLLNVDWSTHSLRKQEENSLFLLAWYVEGLSDEDSEKVRLLEIKLRIVLPDGSVKWGNYRDLKHSSYDHLADERSGFVYGDSSTDSVHER